MTLSRTINLLLLLALVVAIWAVEVVNIFLDHRLNAYGILPRTVEGLRGIAFSPFLHGGFGHLAANTLPLLALGGLIAVRGRGSFPGVTVFIIGIGGAGVWLVGRTALHVGASGLVFGYFRLPGGPGVVRAERPVHPGGPGRDSGLWVGDALRPAAHVGLRVLGGAPVRLGGRRPGRLADPPAPGGETRRAPSCPTGRGTGGKGVK